MQEAKRTPNDVRTARTRKALVAAARRLFVDKGYGDTGTPEIVDCAGVTRGALYHHFADKRAVFRAVVEAEYAALAEAIDNGASTGGTPLAELKAGAQIYFDAMQDLGRARLLLLEGPAVLGVAAMKEIGAITATATLRDALAAAMASSEIPLLPLDALTSLIDAAFDRAALDIAMGAEAAAAISALDALLSGLAALQDPEKQTR